MIEQLKCPFCKGKVNVDGAINMIATCTIDLTCTCCGMKFSYTEHFALSKAARVRLNPSLENIWKGEFLVD